MSINLFVIHDRDQGVPHAEVFNQPIAEALESEVNRIMLVECIENTLGYEAPSYDTPFIWYTFTTEWNSMGRYS